MKEGCVMGPLFLGAAVILALVALVLAFIGLLERQSRCRHLTEQALSQNASKALSVPGPDGVWTITIYATGGGSAGGGDDLAQRHNR